MKSPLKAWPSFLSRFLSSWLWAPAGGCAKPAEKADTSRAEPESEGPSEAAKTRELEDKAAGYRDRFQRDPGERHDGRSRRRRRPESSWTSSSARSAKRKTALRARTLRSSSPEPGQRWIGFTIMSAMILGVAGGTGSGKTTVAREILEAVGPDRIAFLAQDNYYRDVDWESAEHLLAHNFDHPDALDTPLLVEHLRALKHGRAVELAGLRLRAPSPNRGVTAHRSAARRPGRGHPALGRTGDPRSCSTSRSSSTPTPTSAWCAGSGATSPSAVARLRTSCASTWARCARCISSFVEPSKRWADLIVPEGGENRVALEMVVARVEQLLVPAEAGSEGRAPATSVFRSASEPRI